MMGIAEDIVVERRRIAGTMAGVGPDAPVGVGDWTVADLAAHLLAETALGGLVVFVGRALVARGVRLNDRAGGATKRAIAFYRRRGFDHALDRLEAGVPKLLVRPSVAPVTLFEVWLHHDDVCRANRFDPPAEPDSLGAAVDFAIRYQRRALAGTVVDRSVSNGDLLRWLGGRPSSLPPHDPELRF